MNKKNNPSSMVRAAMVLLTVILSTATVRAEDVSIGTVDDWNTFAGRVNDGETTLNGLLTADIDFDGETFTVVGTSAHPFCGTFDGAGHTVTGINISKSGDVSANRQGLFGSVGTGGIVMNVTVSNSSFAGWDYVGGIAGFNQGTIENCHVTSTVTIGTTAMSKQYHGGIVGYNSSVYSTVSHCTSAATVTDSGETGCHYFGGIVGSNSGGTVEHCFAVGSTVSAVTNSGAVVGSNTSTLSYNYYSHCTVGEATSNIGTNNGDITTNDGAVPAIILYDHGTEAADNGTTITDNTGSGKNVALYGRTLYKDGDWNTLCLPFDVTMGSGVFNGAEAMVLDGSTSGLSGTTLTLNFTAATGTIEAGTPFIVKWASGEDAVSPVFGGVTIDNSTTAQNRMSVGFTGGRFVGNYDPFEITEGNINEIIYLGSENTIGYASEPRTLRAFRAHFVVPTTAGSRAMTKAVLNFDGEGETTGIADCKSATHDSGIANSLKHEGWYSLDGRRLNGQPTTKGVYVNNGCKVVIK